MVVVQHASVVDEGDRVLVPEGQQRGGDGEGGDTEQVALGKATEASGTP